MINALASGISGMNAMQSVIDANSSKVAQQTTAIAKASADSPSSVVTLTGGQSDEQFGGQSATAVSDDLADSMVGMNEAVLMYKANANTVRAADEVMGTLLDIMS